MKLRRKGTKGLKMKKQSQKNIVGSMGNGLKAEERISGWGWDEK